MTPYIGPGNDLLPDGTKPLPETVLINRQWCFVTFIWGQFHRKMAEISILDVSLKITNLDLQLQHPGASELTHNFGYRGHAAVANKQWCVCCIYAKHVQRAMNGLCFVMFCYSWVLEKFTHTL